MRDNTSIKLLGGTRRSRGWRSRLQRHLIVLGVGLLFAHSICMAQQEQTRRFTLPNDPEKAWAEVEKVHEALRRPDDWATRKPNADQIAKFQKEVRAAALSFADKAREFVQRFPSDENVGDARITVVHALNHAVAAGDTNAEKQIAAFVADVLVDKSIPEDGRADVLLFSGNVAFMRKAGMRVFTEGMSNLHEESEAALIDAASAALKLFPTNSMLYMMLVSVADRSQGERKKELATKVLNADGAPPATKTLARHILNGTRAYELGKPLDMRFTSLDGRDVDLAKLKGKVVLVEFWSTDCGPCVGEIPALKTAYEKLHPRGFEVVAISLDDKERALRRFIKEKDLPWPQHFDGKGWENRFAVQYGIFSIPTSWLLDKLGNLRVTDEISGDIEGQIELLLQEGSLPAPK
jgi:thiol-disulfide isomerase/thioredoxin